MNDKVKVESASKAHNERRRAPRPSGSKSMQLILRIGGRRAPVRWMSHTNLGRLVSVQPSLIHQLLLFKSKSAQLASLIIR